MAEHKGMNCSRFEPRKTQIQKVYPLVPPRPSPASYLTYLAGCSSDVLTVDLPSAPPPINMYGNQSPPACG